MKTIFTITILLFFIGCAVSIQSNAQEKLKQAIRIGKMELCKANKSFCDVEYRIIDADEGNSRWNKAIHITPELLEHDNIKQMELDKSHTGQFFFQKKRNSYSEWRKSDSNRWWKCVCLH